MQIYNGTGVTETAELLLTKGIGSLLVCTNKTFDQLSGELISIYVEKAGKNKDIARDILLKDFMLLASYGEDAVLPLSTFETSAMCELTEDGGYIHLDENETIKFKLTNLDATKTYALYGIEEPVGSKEILMYQRKTMASESLNQDYDTKGYDLLVMTKDASIKEISFTYDNGAVVKHLPIELEALQKSVDPIQIIKSSGSTSYDLTRFQVPLKGIVNVNIQKTPGVMLNINLRIDEGDYELYQLSNRN